MEISVELLKKLEIEQPYDPDIWLLGMDSKDSTSYHKHLQIHVYCCSIYNSKEMGSLDVHPQMTG